MATKSYAGSVGSPDFIGAVGERLEVQVRWYYVKRIDRSQREIDDLFLHVGEVDGRSVVYRGTKLLVGYRQIADRLVGFDTPQTTLLRFTVKAHGKYRGKAQTQLCRPSAPREPSRRTSRPASAPRPTARDSGAARPHGDLFTHV